MNLNPEHHGYTYQSQSDKLRLTAVYHAAEATANNKTISGWTYEASWHWEAAIDLLAVANRVDVLTKENAFLWAERIKMTKELEELRHFKRLALNKSMDTA